MAITAAMVKELRERTGAGMMECKKALVETGGNLDEAIDELRKSGAAQAQKKAGRVAAEGCIEVLVDEEARRAVAVEVNSETDFVAKDDTFRAFAARVAGNALALGAADVETLMASAADGQASLEDARQQLVAKLGENITVRRSVEMRAEGDRLGTYVHGNSKIGVIVDVAGGDAALAKDLAMHIAASRPLCVQETEVPKALLAKEKEILAAQAQESGKPPDIIEKMVQGRVKKFLKEVTLVGQPFVKDPDQSVAALLQANGARVLGFVRYEVGEGVEKKQENFAAEVMAQVRGS